MPCDLIVCHVYRAAYKMQSVSLIPRPHPDFVEKIKSGSGLGMRLAKCWGSDLLRSKATIDQAVEWQAKRGGGEFCGREGRICESTNGLWEINLFPDLTVHTRLYEQSINCWRGCLQVHHIDSRAYAVSTETAGKSYVFPTWCCMKFV